MRPDFETWWQYYRQGCQMLECTLDMRIVKGWKHRNMCEITKTDPHNVIVSCKRYFAACLSPEEFGRVYGVEDDHRVIVEEGGEK